jgi:hypothetical protein
MTDDRKIKDRRQRSEVRSLRTTKLGGRDAGKLGCNAKRKWRIGKEFIRQMRSSFAEASAFAKAMADRIGGQEGRTRLRSTSYSAASDGGQKSEDNQAGTLESLDAIEKLNDEMEKETYLRAQFQAQSRK